MTSTENNIYKLFFFFEIKGLLSSYFLKTLRNASWTAFWLTCFLQGNRNIITFLRISSTSLNTTCWFFRAWSWSNNSFNPLQFGCSSITITYSSLSMFQIINKFSSITGTIFPFINSITIFFIITIISLISICIFIKIISYPNSIAISCAVFEFPLITGKICPSVGSLSIKFSINIVAIVGVSVFKYLWTFSIFNSI